ncbi:unnamed protein product [Closterium sp. NIES-54]
MKQSDGSSMAMGSFVADAGGGGPVVRLGGARGFAFGGSSESHERTVMRGRNEIAEIAERLAVRPREDMIGSAHRLYQLALNRNFTRGRRVAQVAAACLYLACRQEKKPFLLIDFADLLQINVYVLGAVYLQLLLVLRLENHEPLQAPLDPSLFIHRFADRKCFSPLSLVSLLQLRSGSGVSAPTAANAAAGEPRAAIGTAGPFPHPPVRRP